MSRKCQVTGKTLMFGNNVSHSQRKTRRTFMVNVQDTDVYSETLGRSIRIRVSTAGLRTLDHKGGLDQFLLDTPKSKLDPELHDVKSKVEKAVAAKSA
ncbi:MAG TPA: 50S ribosomal protein L28 [Alphaproteobacteria bacterium]|nr:50S ribosomal protein L28 [Alphaproteobacteria bacterium]HNS45565.1 50S ribosomal protein L28 [Alphaproteobacteria bacterium]